MTKKFLRRTWNRYSKLGKKREKKQVWRKPKGRDNKMREKRKGYPTVVSIGYKKKGELRGKVQEKRPVLVYSISDLGKIKKDDIAIIGNVGKKKKIEIVKKAKKEKISIQNINVKKFLKQVEKKEKEQKSKIEAEKKAKKPKKEKKTKEKSKPKTKEDKK